MGENGENCLTWECICTIYPEILGISVIQHALQFGPENSLPVYYNKENDSLWSYSITHLTRKPASQEKCFLRSK